MNSLKVISRLAYSTIKWSNLTSMPVLGICSRKFTFEIQHPPSLTKSLIPTRTLVSKPKKKHACPYHECKKECHSPSALKIHVDTVHLKLKPHKCEECGEAFGQKGNLTIHMNTIHNHLKLKPHKCEECGQSFSQKGNLTKHINTVHLKLKPHKCEECGAAFGEKANLTKHMNTVHLKLKPHKCQECGEFFSEKGNLTQHMNAVHPPYKCKYCKEVFKDQDSLDGHITLIHKNLNDPIQTEFPWEELSDTWKNIDQMDRVKNRDEETKIEVMKYFLLKKRNFKEYDHLGNLLYRFLQIENFEKNNEISGSLLSLEERNYIKSYLFQTYAPEFNDKVCPVCKKVMFNVEKLRTHIEKVHLNIIKHTK